MKKTTTIMAITLALLMMTMSFASAVPVVNTPLTGIGYTAPVFPPVVFLNQDGGRVLIDDPYGPFANGDIVERENNQAYTGEQIQYNILVLDKNGVEKIKDVGAGWVEQNNGPLPPVLQANCDLGPQLQDGEDLSSAGFPDVRVPGEEFDHEEFDSNFMEVYTCTITIEPSCHGQKWFGIVAEDLDGETGYLQEAESWFCNPELSVGVSGNLDFGEVGPGQKGAATISIENAAEAGSGANIILAIDGKDFYDPTSSGAKCPTTNKLDLQGVDAVGDFETGFWYTASMGSNTVGKKRIPYGDGQLSSADPIFSSSSDANDWNKWKFNELPSMSPGSEASLTLSMGLPVPCNGEFVDGYIGIWALGI